MPLKHQVTVTGVKLARTDWEDVDTHQLVGQATGDIIYATSATDLSRLAIGANGQVLGIVGGLPAWGDSINGFAITNDGTKTTLLGTVGDYIRIGDAAGTSHGLASEDDLMVSGKFEVDGPAYCDNTLNVKSTFDAEWTAYFRLGIIMYSTQSIDAGASAGHYTTLDAFDTGNAMVEVARWQGAADPYFSTGGGQEFKFYNSGVATFGAVTLGATVTLNGQAFDAGAVDAIITTTGTLHGLMITNSNSSHGPTIIFDHAHSTPTIGTYSMAIRGLGYDGAAVDNWVWSQFLAVYDNVGNGTEANHFEWSLTTAGAVNVAMTLTGAGGLGVDADIGTADDPVALFDKYDDALVLKQGIQQRNLALLVDIGVFSRKDTGSGYMMNVQPMTRLLAGGIYQNRAMLDDTVEEVTALRNRVEGLESELAEIRAN